MSKIWKIFEHAQNPPGSDMNPNDISPNTIHNLFIQQIQNLSVNSHLRNAINLMPARGEV